MPRAISRTVADHACPCHVPRARTLLPALAGLDTSSPADRRAPGGGVGWVADFLRELSPIFFSGRILCGAPRGESIA